MGLNGLVVGEDWFKEDILPEDQWRLVELGFHGKHGEEQLHFVDNYIIPNEPIHIEKFTRPYIFAFLKDADLKTVRGVIERNARSDMNAFLIGQHLDVSSSFFVGLGSIMSEFKNYSHAYKIASLQYLRVDEALLKRNFSTP